MPGPHRAVEVAYQFSMITNRHGQMGPLLNEFVQNIKNLTGCSAVGIRMMDSPVGIWHQAQDGFRPDYLESSECSYVGSPRCPCVDVLKGDIKAGLKCSRESGTVYTNNLSRFRRADSEGATQNTPALFSQFDFESAALVPVRLGNRIIGLMHVADHRRGKFTAVVVQLLGAAAVQLAMGAERIIAENALRRSENRYRTLVETMTQGVAVTDEKFALRYANPRFCAMLAYGEAEIIGRPLTDFIDPSSVTQLVKQLARLRLGECEPFEIVCVKKGGGKLVVLFSPNRVTDGQGQFSGSFAVVTDLTSLITSASSLRKSEAELRALSFGLMRGQEAERRRISRELHDDLGQALTSAKLQMAFVRKNLPDSLKEECDSVTQQLSHALEKVRGLSAGLSPVIVEDLGFLTAIHWLLDDFSRQNNIRVTLSSEEAEPPLSGDARIILYRIFQEALANIRKHAKAKTVTVVIRKQEGDISFSVADDGRGFDLDMVYRGKPSGLGLTTIRERIRMLEGHFDLWSERGRGTRLSFTIPLRNSGTL
jgi:PAS domain S-box-containing protein